MKSKQQFRALLGLAAAGAIAAFSWHTGLSGPAKPERKPLFYQDSMHPWVKSDKPGKCTVCAMDLTPIYEGQKGFGPGEDLVMLSTNSITVLNVQREEVKRRTLASALRVAGTLEAKENRKTILSSPAPARVVSVAVENPGVEVQEGQTVLTLYSPELAVKRQYASRGGSAPPVSVNRAGQADEIYHCALGTPISGIVVERNVYQGQYVAEGEKLMTIVDTSVLVFRFDVYEKQLPWLEAGQEIAISVAALPGRTFKGKISVIEPLLNDATRTVKVRAEIHNPVVESRGGKERLLRVGMYADGRIRTELPEVLTVPRTAILFPGGKAYAYVEKADGAYQRQPVKLGRQGNHFWEVLDGLKEGERVVTSGNVLIDAQAQFNQGQPDGEREEDQASAEVADVNEQVQSLAQHSMEPAVEHRSTLAGQPMAMPTEAAVVPPSPQQALSPAAAPDSTPSISTNTPGRFIAPSRAYRSRVAMADREREWNLRHATIQAALASQAAEPPSPPADENSKALPAFLAAADAIRQALADDKIERFNEHAALLPSFLPPLEKAFGPPHPWSELVRKVAASSKLKPAQDLAEARAQFLPFSTAVVDLSKAARKADKSFAGLKIYHCPMAPKPGLWVQCQGPLRNPFYGAKMLECGEEVTQ